MIRTRFKDAVTAAVSVVILLATALGTSAQRTGTSRPAPTIQAPDAVNGTFRWNPAKSENIADVVDTVGNLSDRQKQELSGFLREDESLAIEIRGSAVTVISGGIKAIYTADGRTRPDSAAGGGATVRVSVRGAELTITKMTGDTDVTTIYSVAENRDELKVTRRVTTAYLQETVFKDSFYDRSSATAEFDDTSMSDEDSGAYSSNDPKDKSGSRPPSTVGANTGGATRRPPANRPGNFIVPNGTIVTGILENDIITGVSQENDRFRLTVSAPSEFKGAVITGYLTGISRSGKVSGRAQMTFNFETIRLTNGRTHDFGGYISTITDPSGKTVKVDTEGTAKGDDQTKETAKRGGIGAGIGAVLGAIIGGGNGAVLGAVIGGSAGAGSVIAQGNGDLKIAKGAAINVQASSPR